MVFSWLKHSQDQVINKHLPQNSVTEVQLRTSTLLAVSILNKSSPRVLPSETDMKEIMK